MRIRSTQISASHRMESLAEVVNPRLCRVDDETGKRRLSHAPGAPFPQTGADLAGTEDAERELNGQESSGTLREDAALL